MMDVPDDVANAASQAMLAVARTIFTNAPAPMGGQLSQNAKVADPEPFNGSQDKTSSSSGSIHIAITMQINTFADERIRSCMHSHSCAEGWLSSGL